MSFQQKDNNGSLFKNDKGGNENRPDYKGKIMVAGVEYWLSAWIKEPRGGGEKFMSLSVTPKDARDGQGQQRSGGGGSRPRPAAPLDDSVPFAPCVD